MHAYGEGLLAVFVVVIVAPLGLGSILSCTVALVRFLCSRRAVVNTSFCPGCGKELEGSEDPRCDDCGIGVRRVVNRPGWPIVACVLVFIIQLVAMSILYFIGINWAFQELLDLENVAAIYVSGALAVLLALAVSCVRYVTLRCRYGTIGESRCMRCGTSLKRTPAGPCKTCQVEIV